MKRIRVAQIGVNTNSHSQQIFLSLRKQSDIFEVVGYALPENERERLPKRIEIFEGYRELTVDEVLNDPTIDAVSIETDEVYLTKYALMAARAGKHIHMEKPGGASLEDFEELISLMRASGKVFHTGYMYRYNPCIRQVIERVRNGEIGEVISVDAQMNCLHSPCTRQWLEALPGGMMFFLGCHLIDLVLTIQGKPDNIIPYNRSTGADGVTALDFGYAVLEYGNGISTVKTSAREYGGYARRQLVIVGTKGTIELKPLERPYVGEVVYTGKCEYLDEGWHDVGDYSESTPADRYDGMIEAFGKYVLGEKENPYTLDYELELFRTLLKCCGE